VGLCLLPDNRHKSNGATGLHDLGRRLGDTGLFAADAGGKKLETTPGEWHEPNVIKLRLLELAPKRLTHLQASAAVARRMPAVQPLDMLILMQMAREVVTCM
jgi:hypothetical protein